VLNPVLGRVAAGLNGLGLISLFPEFFIASVEPFWSAHVFPFYMAIVLGLAFVAGVLAMMRRQSRTNLAYASLYFSIFAWCCCVPGFFRGD
jgi:hypothetical protein